ncbi:hypothetical protein [Sabulicella glaciei]|uniref:Uncharacterized protein n=1 Tax=Sabulicella glaciei TaxID=2984948 RepID=A0ABT3NWI5_9PROT|nr:hypothetical protein [Roseococcus sp. MDT2-1-1]MCW8086495.1 hypothetical protein [Roseococcus sp. MDT2-1-1]
MPPFAALPLDLALPAAAASLGLALLLAEGGRFTLHAALALPLAAAGRCDPGGCWPPPGVPGRMARAKDWPRWC